MFEDNNISYEKREGGTYVASIKVFGIGGGGNNAVNRMIQANIKSAEFYAINTDKQALYMSLVKEPDHRIQIGSTLTRGLGAGADPEIGRAAAEENKEAIAELLKNTDLLFITAGMGGGTGTGAAPVIAAIAKELGILTIAVVTKPFAFEGNTRMKNAELGIANLRKCVDTIVIIPNDKLITSFSRDITVVEAFKRADDVLRQGISGISDLIVYPAMINLDFADVKTVMHNRGMAHMGLGIGKGPNKTVDAIKQAVFSPLLETTIEGSTGLIINITGGEDLKIYEVYEGVKLVRDVVDPTASLIFGADIRENMTGEVQVTIIATGFDAKNTLKSKPNAFFNEKVVTNADNASPSTKDLYGTKLTSVYNTTEGDKEQPLTPKAKAVATTVPEGIIRVEDDSSIPAFLRKLKR
ncbi:MAG: cell division protein FtsZ [Clostridia bacterium]